MRTLLTTIAILLAGQSAFQRNTFESRDYQLEFEITQGRTCTGPLSNDQITIVFSNAPGAKVAAAPSVLGEDVMAEFSFSARDLDEKQPTLRLRRRVRDRSFLEARYIRLVNLGGDGWCGGTLALSLDGRRILLAKVAGQNRGRLNENKGLQDWNRANWSERSYWEEQLQRLLPPTLPK